MKLAPSILAADFRQLGEQIQAAERAEADQIHIDVMDGRFVPSISFGLPIIKAAKASTSLPLDVHLMILEPEKHLQAMREAGADSITVHYETCPHLHATLQSIRALGCRAGVAINPHTPASLLSEIINFVDIILVMTVNPGAGGQSLIPETLPKITQIRKKIDASQRSIDLSVDGGVDATTIATLSAAGADVFVAGSSVFGYAGGIAAGMAALRTAL